MGNSQGSGGKETVIKKQLSEVRDDLKSKLGGVEVSGRYHAQKGLDHDYELTDKALGEGYNGSVVLAKDRRTGISYAVKPFKLMGLGVEQMNELRNEVEVFLSMDHPHIARLRDVYECETYLQLVMECLEGGELFDRIQTMKRFSEKDAADSAYQMLLAINYLHSKEIVHRDIKLENFMYDTKAGTHLKLIDFGFSRVWRAGVDKRMEASCGTLSYMAPEVLDESRKGYGHKVDVWSLGVVVFILLMGYMPFAGSADEKNIRKIIRGEYVLKASKWSKLSEAAKEFIQSLLEVNPERRVSASEAIQLPFISNRGAADDAVDESIVQSLREFANASRFRRTCMSMMAWSLTNAERAEVRQAFVEMDTEKCGTLTLEDIRSVLAKYVTLKDEEIKVIFDSLDANRSEEVNYSDFLAAMMTSKIAMHDNLIMEAFSRFDTDNTGYISADNLKGMLSVRLEGISAEEMIAEADLDNDGRISKEEFFRYLRHTDSHDQHKEAATMLIQQELNKKGGSKVVRQSLHQNLSKEPGDAATAEAADQAQKPHQEQTDEHDQEKSETSALHKPSSQKPAETATGVKKNQSGVCAIL